MQEYDVDLYKNFATYYTSAPLMTAMIRLVSTGGFIRSAGFQGMRSYLRRTCTEGWIIDLTPETKRSPVNSRRVLRRKEITNHASAGTPRRLPLK